MTDPSPRLRAIQEQIGDGGYGSIGQAINDMEWLLAELARLTQERDEAVDTRRRSNFMFADEIAALKEQLKQAEAERDEARRERDELKAAKP